MGFYENLNYLLKKYGMEKVQLARTLGVSETTIYQWNKGSMPRSGTLKKISEMFGVSTEKLLNEKPLSAQEQPEAPAGAIPYVGTSATVPLVSLGTIHAGEPIEAIENCKTVEVPRAVAEAHPSAFLLQVVGNCMNRRYPEGCFVLVDPNLQPRNGQAVAVQIDSDEVVLRTYSKGASTLMLTADSYDGEYEDLIFTGNSLQEVKLLGLIVWFQAAADVR